MQSGWADVYRPAGTREKKSKLVSLQDEALAIPFCIQGQLHKQVAIRALKTRTPPALHGASACKATCFPAAGFGVIRSYSSSSPLSLGVAFSLQHHVGHKPLPSLIPLWLATPGKTQSEGQNLATSSPGSACVAPRQSCLDQHHPCATTFTSLHLCKSQDLKLRGGGIPLEVACECSAQVHPSAVREMDRWTAHT